MDANEKRTITFGFVFAVVFIACLIVIAAVILSVGPEQAREPSRRKPNMEAGTELAAIELTDVTMQEHAGQIYIWIDRGDGHVSNDILPPWKQWAWRKIVTNEGHPSSLFGAWWRRVPIDDVEAIRQCAQQMQRELNTKRERVLAQRARAKESIKQAKQ